VDCSLAVIWVHYWSGPQIHESIEAVAADLERWDGGAELVVVDNGGLDRVRPGVTVVETGRNTGYAGGINRGVKATTAPFIVAMNPDVLVRPGCLGALSSGLRRFPIVAPRLCLDRGCLLQLPLTEPRDFVSVLIAELGRHCRSWTPVARMRWRRHARRQWTSARPLFPSHDLSGAMLAFTRAAYETAGPWDEGFPLYFEETDWLRRSARLGLEAAVVNAAEAVHLYAGSTRHSPYAEHWFRHSAARYEKRHYKAWQRRVLREVRRRPRAPAPPDSPSHAPRRGPVWAELSSDPCGFPAAAGFADEPGVLELTVTRLLDSQLPAGRYWLRWVDNDDRELGVAMLSGGVQ